MKTTCTAMIKENGTLKIEGAKTLGTYHKLFYENHPPMEGCFFAFSRQQFEEGYEQIKHLLGENEKIVSVGNGSGLYGKREYIDRFFDFYNDKNKLIREQCDPQEVYYDEYNNYEVCYTLDDEKAIKIIIDIWGADVAKTIHRINDALTVDQILMYNLEKKIKMLHYKNKNSIATQPKNVWFDEKGLAYTIVDACLKPVYQANSKQYMNKKFANLTAYYDGKKLYKFHIE